ncbi:alpha-ketoglutarate-dependent dioxygenase AlkB family protein [Pedobacter alpinus]|uniref:Alpha-ketoglutarate-dependent dioxygenase AlkB family protein n=1 Tax=Pedobacter alpinus TaxID=1590643 RepID=A0ABW5TSD0_9SPHI
MDLFNSTFAPNILPQDGIVNYYGQIMSVKAAQEYTIQLLNNIAWKNDEAIIYGKHIITKRKVAWYADSNFAYTYSKITREALPWTAELLTLKKLTEEITQKTFNSCLLNLYQTGEEGMAWHSDDEKSLGKDTAIASLSFGAERKFAFKHKKTQEKVELFLQNGSLLLMHGATQTNWLHRLPPTKKISLPRVNLTFRTIVL